MSTKTFPLKKQILPLTGHIKMIMPPEQKSKYTQHFLVKLSYKFKYHHSAVRIKMHGH